MIICPKCDAQFKNGADGILHMITKEKIDMETIKDHYLIIGIVSDSEIEEYEAKYGSGREG